MMIPKLLILDLDGTTVPMIAGFKGQPSDVVQTSIRSAIQRGVHISIATGRPLQKAVPLIEKLGIVDPCIVADGAMIYDPVKKMSIEKRVISLQKIEEIAYRLGEYVKYYKLINAEDEHLYTSDIDKTDVVGMVIVGVPEEECELMYNRIRDIEGVSIHRIPVTFSKTLYTITDPLSTKQVAVTHLMEYFHLTPEEIIAVGDSENDIPMILAAGVGVAMGNASEGLKSVADDVTTSVTEDGVAAVIEKYFPNQ